MTTPDSALPAAIGARESCNNRNPGPDGVWPTMVSPRGLKLHLFPPDRRRAESTYVDWDGSLQMALTALLPLAGCDPLHVIFSGPVGCGKTEAASTCALLLGLPSHTLVGHHGLEGEDVVVSPVMAGKNKVVYVASPILSAFLGGGRRSEARVAIYDEIGKAAAVALAPLASALDTRREVTSSIVQETFRLNPGAHFIATAESSEHLPDYITIRMTRIRLSIPPAAATMEIIRKKYPGTPEILRDAFSDWLLSSATPIATRKAILVLHLGQRLLAAAGNPRPSARTAYAAIESAAKHF